MYLNYLTQREKRIFLKLSHVVSEADGIVLENEMRLIHQYAEEMQISPEEMAEEDVDSILAEISNNSTKKAKRIIYAELLAIALVDDNYEESEIVFMKKIANLLKISPIIEFQISNAVSNYVRACDYMVRVIEKED